MSNLVVRFSETRISTDGSPKAPKWRRCQKNKKKTANHKVPKHFTSLLKKENTLLTADFPTTTESPRRAELLRWWVEVEVEVRGGRPQVQNKVSLCNKTSLQVKQKQENKKNRWQASSWRLLVRLAAGDRSPLWSRQVLLHRRLRPERERDGVS